MKPPYEITPLILKLVTSISEMIGEVNAYYLRKPSPVLRKQNRIKTIHSSLEIEGNTLTQEQVTAIIENKHVIGPQKDILEVQNAIKVYDLIGSLNPFSTRSFLEAHRLLMQGLVENPGKYRTKEVGIFQGSNVAHIAPPANRVTYLMNSLFNYLKNEDELTLIKSCVFHYEMEFIHPFMDGNGRMGRLWQTVILMSKYPLFQFLPFETLINKTQKEYYKSLAQSDKQGSSTPFIEYMLSIIKQSLAELINFNNRTLSDTERLEYFIGITTTNFSRKDYMNVFKDISPATASRDLKKGVEMGWLKKEGEKNRTIYRIVVK